MNISRQSLTNSIQNLHKLIIVLLLVTITIASAAPMAKAQDIVSDSSNAANGSWSFDTLYNLVFNPNLIVVDVTPTNNKPAFTVTAALPKPAPIPKPASIKSTMVVEASGYSSTPDQTDDSPFITASGTHVRDGIIATNFLPFGTVIKIPDVYGDKVFVVEDRMNKRYDKNIDIWFADRSTALKFGRKNVRIEIVAVR